MDHNFLTASIPTFRLNVHVRRLVSAGYKGVGVVYQGHAEAAQDLGGGEEGCGAESNYLLCVVEKSVLGEKSNRGVEGGFDVRIGIVAVEDINWGCCLWEFNDNFLRSALEAVVVSLSPAELASWGPSFRSNREAFAGPASNVRVERASRDCFTDGGALAEVMTLCFLRPYISNTEMVLSANALQQLEIFTNNSDGSERRFLGANYESHSYYIWLQASYALALAGHLIYSVDYKNFSIALTTPSEFIAVIQAILSAGKQLQQLNIGEEDNNKLRSNLLKKLILIASSASVIGDYSSEAFQMAGVVLKENYGHGSLSLAPPAPGKKRELGWMESLPTDVKVPSNWVKINSTKKTIRYHPPEVVTALDRLSLAKEELTVACRAAWDSFLRDFSKHYAEFQAAVQALAALDCLHSLAILSRYKGYCQPVFVDDYEPVQIQICFCSSLLIGSQRLIITENTVRSLLGPNMGGKSCYVRQVALIAIWLRLVSFVPASSTKLHVLDGIYTRMGASDSIHQGRSTFLEELSETSQILHRCTGHSQKKPGPLVTHYPKSANLRTEFPGSISLIYTSLYLVVSERSFGFKVAQLAQLPSHCISRAIVMASKLEGLVNNRIHSRSGKELLLDAPMLDQEQEPHQLMAQPRECPHQDFGRAYKEFYSKLKSCNTR
ncbi:P-loop containing nucleoside triphosphate hydrolase [Sesbania bispinosa]|nr:P-loop containing nucleoside triphosphate hydrolase [Sesbania bispinosa]